MLVHNKMLTAKQLTLCRQWFSSK